MLNIKNIFLNNTFASRDDVFSFISEQAITLNIISKQNKSKLINAFIGRENESTTGFEDGFAIPHARIKSIQRPAIIIIRSKNDIE